MKPLTLAYQLTKITFWLSLVTFMVTLGYSVFFVSIAELATSTVQQIANISSLILGMSAAFLIPVILWHILKKIPFKKISCIVQTAFKIHWKKLNFSMILKALLTLLFLVFTYSLKIVWDILTTQNSYDNFDIEEYNFNKKFDDLGYTIDGMYYGKHYDNTEYCCPDYIDR